MCEFFSFCVTPEGEKLYFNAEQRRNIIAGEMLYPDGAGKITDTDSHTSIADYFGYPGAKEDCLKKHEYNPLLETFGESHSCYDKEVIAWVKGLDFKTIVPELILKSVVHPFKLEPTSSIAEAENLLKQWAHMCNSAYNSAYNSVRNSVRNSVGYSVRNSVGDSVVNSVVNSVYDSVYDSLGDSLGDSVWNSGVNSVGDLVWGSVGDSVWDSVVNSVVNSARAYTSSFFNISYKFDFGASVKLWEGGYVPSFDGKIWRLHTKAGIAWEGEIKTKKEVK